MGILISPTEERKELPGPIRGEERMKKRDFKKVNVILLKEIAGSGWWGNSRSALDTFIF